MLLVYKLPFKFMRQEGSCWVELPWNISGHSKKKIQKLKKRRREAFCPFFYCRNEKAQTAIWKFCPFILNRRCITA